MASPETLFPDFNETLFSDFDETLFSDFDENSTEALFPDENFTGTFFPSSTGSFSWEIYCNSDDDKPLYDDALWDDTMFPDERSIPVAFYVLITVQIVAVLVSVLAVVALLIPLLIQLKKGTFHQSSVTGSVQRRQRQKDQPYSTYNLYMVYLALADLVNLLPAIATEIMAATGKSRYGAYSFMEVFLWDEKFYLCSDMYPLDLTVGAPYAVANLWINAVIAYQILILLKKSHSGIRITQPSLTRVNLQGGVVVLFSVGVGFFFFYGAYIIPSFGAFISIMAVLILAPFFFVIGVTVFIQCRKYMPVAHGSSPRDKALRGLSFYFFRITMVFVVVWLPAGFLFVLSSGVTGVIIAIMIAAFQPILTFCMILTKPDVKKYVKDLVTLSYLFGDDGCTRWRKDNKEAPVIASNSVRRTNSLTMLGYEFSEDADHDANNINVDANADVEQGVDIDDDVLIGGPIDNNGDEENNTKLDVDDIADIDAIPKFRSRSSRGGPATVSATGEAVTIDVQDTKPVERASAAHTISDGNESSN